MKIFACLALPEDDPFWACEAAPLPKLEEEKYLEKADMIIQRDVYKRQVLSVLLFFPVLF